MQDLSQNGLDFLFLRVLKTEAHKGPVAVVQAPHPCGSTRSAFDLFYTQGCCKESGLTTRLVAATMIRHQEEAPGEEMGGKVMNHRGGCGQEA